MAGDKLPHSAYSLENGGQRFFGCCCSKHEGVPVMLNLILLQAKESFANDFVPVPNEEKVTPRFSVCVLRNGVDANAEAERNLSCHIVAGIGIKPKNLLRA